MAEDPRARAARIRLPAGVRSHLRLPTLVRREPALFVLAISAAVVYSVYSIWEHVHFQTEFDLAIADQAVWQYSRFRAPIVTTTVGFLAPAGTDPHINTLGDHFNPILALLAPLYWIWADPRMLLVAQGALVSSAVIPVFVYARPRVGRLGAYLLGVAYLLFWGIHAAVGYNFHELAFAPLLIACVILLADRERWTGYWVALGLLLLVKENMALFAVFVGLWLLLRSEYRKGAITIGVGLAWYFLVTEVLLPHFAGGIDYTHWTYTEFGTDLPSAVRNVFRYPGLPFHELIDDQQKVRTLAWLFVPFLLLLVYSPLIVLCVPLIAQQLFSVLPPFWGTRFHHWLPIAPVLAMGAADGFRNFLRLVGRSSSLAWAGAIAGALMVAGNFHLVKKFPVWRITQPGFTMKRTADEADRKSAVAAVPDGASVTTQSSLLPHLSRRRDIYLLGSSPALPPTDYVVVNFAALEWPDPAVSQAWLDRHRARYDTATVRGSWTVLRRKR